VWHRKKCHSRNIGEIDSWKIKRRRKGHFDRYRSEIGKVRVVVVAVVVVVVVAVVVVVVVAVVVVEKNRQKKAIFQTAFFSFFFKRVYFLTNVIKISEL
jgi:hypothetical protein